ncbi:MAG: 2-C-methyl-D-erythritol 4-phosphate cytidylyltransferase [Bacteroidales bacterium]|jgi:2-C-methyl-D-erythritol 4-phosphate cytidylyltransferase|nr:2-C-methyl-D-erythritol 4-phosphate cytidylyltransferase [Bacteroidales bacterium]
MNIAIILAGGTGTRLGGELPKQFIKIAGKSIIEHSIDAFEKNNNIDKISIVINENYFQPLNGIINTNKYRKIDKIIKGGNERYKSSLNAIKAYSEAVNDNLIFHDAARPLVSQRIINETIMALKNFNAATVAIPSSNTIYKINTEIKTIESVPDRRNLYCAQTPQAFKLFTIKKAYELFLEDGNFFATDDCGILSKFIPDEEIYIINGDVNNIKITYSEEVRVAEELIKFKMNGYDKE